MNILKYLAYINSLMADERPPYDPYDYEKMANNIFDELCELDRDDREHERPAVPHDITVLADRLRAFVNLEDVAYIAEAILDDGLGFIDRDPMTQNVWLTRLGRQHCGEKINLR
jgi:hypothetical protein